MPYEPGDVIYQNPLADPSEVAAFRLEGEACITFPRGRMQMEQVCERDLARGPHGHCDHARPVRPRPRIS